jgi:hypothetical protein
MQRAELPPVQLPDIEPPPLVVRSSSDDKEHLERRRREHDLQLARLRAIARVRHRAGGA